MARQVIDLRLALVIGLLAFVLAVSLDSAGNAAAAADFDSSTYRPAPTATRVTPQPAPTPVSDLDLEDAAARLRHGLMTSPILTSNRLTEAHLFTDLPVEE